MVMSEEPDMVGKEMEVVSEEKGRDKERVSDKEKDLAGEASSAFNSGDYTGCLTTLEKLEILRPTDIVLAHNKIVVQCRAGEVGEGGTTVSLSEVVQQLEGLAKTQGLSLSASRSEDEAESSVLVYNMAVARFQQRHMLQASQLAGRLLPLSSSISPAFARKILFLHCELSLALHQPEQALTHAAKLEEMLGESQGDQADGLSLEQGRVLVLKARCSVMARLTKTLKKELKSVSLPGTLGQTCEFVRSHIEALHGNHRKSIKMLNSVVQIAGNRVFPHYYNNLGCLHQIMRKPNLAIYYFKNALDRLEGGETNQAGQSTSWLTQSQVLYNIGISLLHARRPGVAFDILLEVVGAHYLDPHVWFHLAECCMLAHQPDNLPQGREREVSQGGAGAGLSYKLVATNPPQPPVGATNTPGAAPVLSMDFAYVCLKNAESLLPKSGSGGEGVFCEGVGYIGNPVTWVEVEQLRVAIITCKAYTALSLGDYIPAQHYAEEILSQPQAPLPGCYQLLAHLYAAESLILQDRLVEAMVHLDPDTVSLGDSWEGSSQSLAQTWYPDTVEMGKQAVQYNLAVGFALREEWDKASSIVGQLYREGQDVPVQVLLLVLYLSLKQGQVDKARRIVRERCPATTRPPDSSV